MGRHVLLQAIFPTQVSNPHLLHLLHWQVDSTTTWEITLFLCCSVSRWLCAWVRTSRWEDWGGSWPVEPITWSRETRPQERGRGPNERAAGEAAAEMPSAPGAHENRKPRSGSPFTRAEGEPKKNTHKAGKRESTAYFLSKNEKATHPSPPLPKHAWSLVSLISLRRCSPMRSGLPIYKNMYSSLPLKRNVNVTHA